MRKKSGEKVGKNVEEKVACVAGASVVGEREQAREEVSPSRAPVFSYDH